MKTLHFPRLSRATVYFAMAIMVIFLLPCVSGRTATAKPVSLDMSQPNMGLRDPMEIAWPYEDEFSYEVNLNGAFSPLDKPGKETFTSEYTAGETGGIFMERYELRAAMMLADTSAVVDFDEHRMIKEIRNKLGIKFIGSGTSEDEGFDATHTFDGSRLNINAGFYGSNLPDDALRAEIKIGGPDDGCFLFGGSDLPGCLALLLSSVDIDGDEPVEVWTYNGGDWILGFPTVGIFRFMRLGIVPIENASAEAQKWYNRTRDKYDDWVPGDDVRVVILENLGDTFSYFYEDKSAIAEVEDLMPAYPGEGPFAAAYIDAEGRLIRIEQPSGLLADLSVLKKIGPEGPWWGTKGE